MRWRFRPAIWIALVTTGFAGMCHAQTSRVADRSDADVARQLFQRFLERLQDDVPVAGEFEIKRTPAKGLGRGLPQQDRLLRCRWAWDRDRKMLEGLPESNLFEHFLSTRRALLLGMGPKNYNLSGPKHAYPLCPSGFYFLVGLVPWFDHANDEVRLVESDADTPPGTKVVRVQLRPKGHVHLFIRERDGRHLGHDTFWEGQVFHRLRISKLMNYSDGRAFPSSARLQTFLSKGPDPAFTDELRTIHLQFPRGKEQVEAAFATEIPAGSEIHDLERNTHVTRKSATQASDIIEQKVRRERARGAR